MITGDGAYIKKINRGLILSKIIEHDVISRADLSKITGLNKATISVQVADLLDAKLIYETQLEHNVVGRRPIMLSVNRQAGYVLGIDLDYKHIQYTISDLGGNPVHYQSETFETTDFNEIVRILINQIKAYQQQWANSTYGLISVMIGIHGTVNNDESIDFVPTYQWHHKDLKNLLVNEIDIDIRIENNANLSAYAERVYKHHHSNHLIALGLSSGIGAGIMIDGKMHKGFHGFAGEMGHMIISPDGKPCTCGNHGCWELYATEPVFLEQLSIKLNKPNITYADIEKLIAEQEPVTSNLMALFIRNLSIGLNNVINLYNPESLVINSKLLKMHPNAIEDIKKNLVSSVSQYREISISELGGAACVMGACALAIQHFLEVPKLILTISDHAIQHKLKEEIELPIP